MFLAQTRTFKTRNRVMSTVNASKKTYLLVLDLPEMMEAYERVGLEIPDISFFQGCQQRLIKKLWEIMPDYSLEMIEANKLTNKIVSLLHDLLTVTPEAVVVSTVGAVAAKTNGHCLQINRVIDPTGKTLGVGARPGNNSLLSQFDEIKERFAKKPVVLVEDGSFSGSTMKCMIEICSAMQIEIKCIAIGFLFSPAMEAILKVFPREKDILFWRKGNFVDWMPDHDFFPFVPNSGKVIGFPYATKLMNFNMPVYLHSGVSLCKPYVLPYGNPVEWASIPEERAKEFSVFCLRETREIFHEMERLNRRPITLEHIIGTYPHVSFPVDRHETEFPPIKTRILELLLKHENGLAFSS